MRKRSILDAQRTPVIFLAAIVSLGLCLTACRSQTPARTEGSPSPAVVKRFELKGKVVSIDLPQKKVVVDAQDIPGFMGAMTMPYPVKDAGLLDKLASGDQITAQVLEGEKEFWLENIVVVQKGTGSQPPPSK